MGYQARIEIMLQVAEMLASDEEDIKYRSRLFTREHGKIARETLMEMSRLGDRFRQAAAYGERIMVDEIMGPAGGGPQLGYHRDPAAARRGLR